MANTSNAEMAGDIRRAALSLSSGKVNDRLMDWLLYAARQAEQGDISGHVTYARLIAREVLGLPTIKVEDVFQQVLVDHAETLDALRDR
jgi:hypothetical protein